MSTLGMMTTKPRASTAIAMYRASGGNGLQSSSRRFVQNCLATPGIVSGGGAAAGGSGAAKTRNL